ncbi:hypothetical protein CTAYLR_010004 [Chrysophaeum taylorii]|uniref:6-phosphogluconate dehydrogenase NADP-binding domain-containing protein n=1 Tax=Chrysophaeum taylorii TaxID=2483200 RepID=A0AAD7UJG5_9STRA|nr:hypothetical protein CTAYLR_010004 [Chrysophaeum taylorii]
MSKRLGIRVGVLGCGKMGSAMIERLTAMGHGVVAWNRSGQRAIQAAEKCVQERPSSRVLVAATPRHAMSALSYSEESAVAIVMVTDCEAAQAMLKDLEIPANVVVANLTSGSPTDGRRTAEVVKGAYIDGAYCGPPEAARSGSGQVFVSGSEADYEAAKDVLGNLGRVRFLAGPVGASRALDYAVVDLAFVNLVSFCASAAMLEKEGVEWEVFCEEAESRLAATPVALRLAADRMRREVDYHEDQVATLKTWRHFWASRIPYFREADLAEPHLARFAVDLLDKAGAQDPSLADSDITRLQEVFTNKGK